MDMPENKIHLFSKCVERRYAEMLFYDGVLHFGYPSEWIKKAEEGNVGQGDLLEGVCTNENKFWNFFQRWFPRLVHDKETGTKYLRSRSIVNWPCYCLYSISEQTEPVGREGDCVAYDMSEAYAQDFSGEETWENRFKTGFPDRKAMVVIHRPQVFLDKVKRHFADFRLEEGRDYYMGFVQYRKEGEKFTYKEVPWELFHKDARFEKQQEYRIALNPRSRKVKELLRGGQNVALGSSLEDCAMLKSHFYKGARILVKGDNVRLEIRDWSNLSGPLHEIELVPLLQIFGIPMMNSTCILDGKEVDTHQLFNELDQVLKTKYRILFFSDLFFSGGGLRISYSWENEETIKENEVKDSYYYLRKYPKHYKAPFFEGVYVPSPAGKQKYTSLTYELQEVVVPKA